MLADFADKTIDPHVSAPYPPNPDKVLGPDSPQADMRRTFASHTRERSEVALTRFHICEGQMTTAPTTARVAEIETPVGVMVASASDAHLFLLEFGHRKLLDAQLERVRRGINCVFERGESPIIDMVRTQLDEYFRAERREFTVPLRTSGTPFQNRVWAELQRIPIGTTTTYAAVARNIGQPTAVRAVAHANGDNRIAIIIPCHRVIGSDGSLTGYGGGLSRKRQLLDLEGGSLTLAGGAQ